MYGIQGEYYFYQLLEGEKRERLRPRLRCFNVESALDIGCGDGRALLGLHYHYGVRVLYGCERRTERGVIRTSPTDIHGRAPTSLKEARSNIARIQGDVRTSDEIEVSIAELMKNVRYDPDAVELSADGTSDAVICSQVLHYSKDEVETRAILDLISTQGHSESLVYFSVKDNYLPERSNIINGDVLLKCCEEYMMRLRLTHSIGHVCSEGTSHIFTNL